MSYNRPIFPYNSLFNTDGRQADWYMNSEYPMIRWLERNGYDVTIPVAMMYTIMATVCSITKF